MKLAIMNFAKAFLLVCLGMALGWAFRDQHGRTFPPSATPSLCTDDGKEWWLARTDGKAFDCYEADKPRE